MSFFSKSILNKYHHPHAADKEPKGTQQIAFESFGKAISGFEDRILAAAKARKKAELEYRVRRFAHASEVGYAEVEHKANKTLREFFQSNGDDIAPAEGEVHDLGFGVTLRREDFFEKDGNRRTYSEVLGNTLDKYSEERRKLAPTPLAQQEYDFVFKRAKLRSVIGAEKYEVARSGVKYANDLNTVVRAYKQSIANNQGLNLEHFSTHLEALKGLSERVPFVDKGQAKIMFQTAAKDLVAVAVEEGVVGKDNDAALRVLGSGPLANTESVRLAMSGLPWKDKKLLAKYRKQYQGAYTKYGPNSPLPRDRMKQFDWALGQISAKELEGLQARAVKSFSLQTDRVRAELNKRVQGSLSSISLLGLKDSAFRENLISSLETAARDIARVYPKDIYPGTNGNMMASVLVARQMVDQKNVYDGVSTAQLRSSQISSTEAAKLAQNIQKQMPAGSLASIPVHAQAYKMFETFRKSELALRETDPGGSLRRVDKQIGRLDMRLKIGDYTSPHDRIVDQVALREAVKRRSKEIGVAPAFISATEENEIKQLVDLGNLGEAYAQVREMRKIYGDETYSEYIRPQIVGIKGAEEVSIMAMMENPQVSERILGSQLYIRSMEKGAIKGSKFAELDKSIKSWQDKLTLPPNRVGPDFLGFPFHRNTLKMDAIRGWVDDNIGQSARSEELKGKIESMIPTLAAHVKYTTGQTSDEALQSALDIFISGLGKMDDTGRITPGVVAQRFNPAEREDMDKMFYDSRFIKTSVVPNLDLSNELFKEQSVWDKLFDNPAGNALDLLEERDITKWLYTGAGAIPTITHPLLGFRVPYPHKKGGEFKLSWDEVSYLLGGQKK